MDATTLINTNIATELLDLVVLIAEKAFTVFPINVFLVSSLIGIGFGIFRKAKRTVL